MLERTGANTRSIRRINCGRTLRCILSDGCNTRVEIASALRLTKTTLTNIVNELTAKDILIEQSEEATLHDATKLGRKSIALALADNAPLIMGILILRKRICGILGTMDGEIVERRNYDVPPDMTAKLLETILTKLFLEVSALADREVLAVSVVCIGPLDCERGILLRPTNFYMEDQNFHIKTLLRKHTALPIIVTHDAAAAAINEKYFGRAHDSNTFMFLQIEEGIGAGLYLDGKLYRGAHGHNGEIGHTSIQYNGELCKCGNRGCLELYANAEKMRIYAEQFRAFMPAHPIFKEALDMYSIIRLADAGDTLSKQILLEYCKYIAHALWNTITLLNIREIYVSSPTETSNRIFEETLVKCLDNRQNTTIRTPISIISARHGIDAPLHGAISVVMDNIFDGTLSPRSLLKDC